MINWKEDGPEILIGFSVLLVLAALAYSWLTFEPEPLDVPACNCQGKGPDCELRTFDDGRTRSQCALWGDRSSCCLVIDLTEAPND